MSRREKKRQFRLTCKLLLEKTSVISNPITSLKEKDNNENLKSNLYIENINNISSYNVIESETEIEPLPIEPLTKSITENDSPKKINVIVIQSNDITTMKYDVWKNNSKNLISKIFKSDLSDINEQNNNSNNKDKKNNNKKKSKNNNGAPMNPRTLVPLAYPTSITHIVVESNIYDTLPNPSLDKLKELIKIYPNIYYGDGKDIKENEKDLIKVVSQQWMILSLSRNKIAKENEYLMKWNSSILMIFETNEALTPLPERPEKKEYVVDKTKYMCFNSSLIEGIKDSNKVNENKFQINKILTEVFFEYSLLVEQRNGPNDMFRKRAFARASNNIKDLSFEINLTNMNRLKDLIYPKYLYEDKKDQHIFGKGILKRIQEYLDKGVIQEFKILQNDPIMLARMQLTRVWGVGPIAARKLMNDHNIYSIENLIKSVKINPKLLNEQQTIGLNRLIDLEERIPREEMKVLEEFVGNVARKLVPGIQVVVCGSYRRGRPSSGDIDFLFSPRDNEKLDNFMPDLIKELEKLGFLTDHLALPGSKQYGSMKKIKKERKIRDDSDDEDGNTNDGKCSYMGVCKLPETYHKREDGKINFHRRIDMKVYPRSQFAFALLYFTGSDHFNRSMRNFAKNSKDLHRGLNYSLSDKGIFEVIRNNNNKGIKLIKGDAIPGLDTEEKVIFLFLYFFILIFIYT